MKYAHKSDGPFVGNLDRLHGRSKREMDRWVRRRTLGHEEVKVETLLSIDILTRRYFDKVVVMCVWFVGV